MKPLAHQKLDVANQTWGHPALWDWDGQFTLDSKLSDSRGFQLWRIRHN